MRVKSGLERWKITADKHCSITKIIIKSIVKIKTKYLKKETSSVMEEDFYFPVFYDVWKAFHNFLFLLHFGLKAYYLCSGFEKILYDLDVLPCRDEDGEKTEALKPKLIFNPYFQRLYQVIQAFLLL